MRGRVSETDASDAVESALRGAASRRSKRATVVLALDVEPEVREALRERARALGVSLAEYFRSIAAGNTAPHHQSVARVSQPLASVSYRLAQIADARKRDDLDALDKEISAAQTVVADALDVLVKEHAADVRRVAQDRPNPWEGT